MGRRVETSRAHEERVREVLVRVRDDVGGGRLSVGEMARVACASPWHFVRAFRAEVGVSPGACRAMGKKGEGSSAMDYGIGLVKVPVAEFGRARGFYREVLGLEEEFAVEEYGWGQYRVGGMALAIYVVGGGGGEGRPGGERDFHLTVGDARGAYEGIRRRGGRFACDVVASDDGGLFFVVRDPDGNEIKVVQRA